MLRLGHKLAKKTNKNPKDRQMLAGKKLQVQLFTALLDHSHAGTSLTKTTSAPHCAIYYAYVPTKIRKKILHSATAKI